MLEKNKHWEDIVAKVRKNVENNFEEIFTSLDFGAYLYPENYFVSYIFKTNEIMENAKKNGLLKEINDYHRECMFRYGYPNEAIKDCTFASQEECERDYNGNWFYFYK